MAVYSHSIYIAIRYMVYVIQNRRKYRVSYTVASVVFTVTHRPKSASQIIYYYYSTCVKTPKTQGRDGTFERDKGIWLTNMLALYY